MPIDTTKTMLQVEGTKAVPMLKAKIAKGGPFVMYHGALGAAGATIVGHYPWFATHNFLSEKIATPDGFGAKLVRNAGIGFCSSVVSDTISNSVRVVKTTKQTSAEAISYPQAVKMVVSKDGVSGLLSPRASDENFIQRTPRDDVFGALEASRGAAVGEHLVGKELN